MIIKLFMAELGVADYTALADEDFENAVLMDDDLAVVARSTFKDGLEPIYQFIEDRIKLPEDSIWESYEAAGQGVGLYELAHDISQKRYPKLIQAIRDACSIPECVNFTAE